MIDGGPWLGAGTVPPARLQYYPHPAGSTCPRGVTRKRARPVGDPRKLTKCIAFWSQGPKLENPKS